MFAADLTLAEVRQLRARQRWAFRDHSFDGLYGIVTFEEFIALALAAGRPVGIYPGQEGEGGVYSAWNQAKGQPAVCLYVSMNPVCEQQQHQPAYKHTSMGDSSRVFDVSQTDIDESWSAAGSPCCMYAEAKHPSWHNQLPGMQAAHTTLEALMVAVLHAKGYASSAPYGSTAWQSRPIFIQSFEVTSLRRFAAITPVPLALLLDKGAAPDTGLPVSELLSDAALSELSAFVTVMAPWKAMLYTLVERQQRPLQRPAPAAAGLVLLSAHTAANGTGTDSSRRLLSAQADASSGTGGGPDSASSGSVHAFSHPDVPHPAADRALEGARHLQSSGLAARLHRHGFLVHTYTLRDEGQFVLPTCQQGIACEFEFLFESERLDGGFADWPGTMRHWVQGQQQQP